jgi:predicted regulator of Ras-like GTPase activity (Roadblock/LC7/MglB family)
MPPDLDNTIHLRAGYSLSVNQINHIQKVIDDLMEMVPSRFILVVDSSGQLITSAGDRGLIDSSILGSLIAADLAASQEIARLSGDIQDYQMILREGEKSNLVIAQAGDRIAILVCYAKSVPIGWARKLIQIAAKGIAGQVSTSGSEIPNGDLGRVSDLPDLYSDALDEIWKD